MPRKSVTNRNLRRIEETNRERPKREKLRLKASNINLPYEERFAASQALQKLQRDSSPSRIRHRCKLCSRSRGYNRLTGLCRLHMRITMFGMIPGMRKASW